MSTLSPILVHALVPLPWLQSVPPVSNSPNLSLDACLICNRSTAKAVASHPTRFVGVGMVATECDSATLMESARQAISLGMSGFAVYVGPDVKHPMDEVDFWGPFYDLCVSADLPVWIHPCRDQGFGDYTSQNDGPCRVRGDKGGGSKYSIWNSYGWIYDTSVAMVHLAAGGVLERWKGIKFVTHHGGGMVKEFTDR